MAKIINKTQLTDTIFRFTIEAPQIAKKRKAGQFIILRLDQQGERIPLTIADSDPEKGSIDIIIQAVGKTTIRLSQMSEGDEILDLVGPLGEATKLKKQGTVIMVGGGVGTAPLLPIARANKNIGNRVITILGARTNNMFILQKELDDISDELICITNDGSSGKRGMVTDALKDVLDNNKEISEVVAIGPLPMMKAISELTKSYKVHTIVSLNPIMIDGTGMCGGCRVNVGGQTRFACVHGPEFDGHQVDFDTLINRNRTYAEEEHKCRIGIDKFKGNPS